MRGTETKESGTQVRENELFHFESEVVPVLEMLVGRVIEKSLLEVQVCYTQYADHPLLSLYF